MDSIEKYFTGEKTQCVIGIVISIICMSVSIYFIFLQKPVLKGLSYSFIPLSVLLLIICIGIIIRTPKDIERVTTFYKTEPQKLQTKELPRMEKVMKNFTVIKKVEIFIFVVGLLLSTFLWKNELARGIALGLMTQSTILFLFDHNAEIRGKAYFDFLKSL